MWRAPRKVSTARSKGSKTAAYCRLHAKDGMVDVRSRHCLHDSCKTFPSFNVEGSKTAIYCKRHAEVGMVNIHTKRCSHDGCTRQALWGLLSGGAGTACTEHKSDILDAPVINFRAPCQVPGCRISSTWGPSGQQPSHCHDHGPLDGSFVLSVRSHRHQNVRHSPPSRAVGGPPFQVKAECYFKLVAPRYSVSLNGADAAIVYTSCCFVAAAT